MKTNLYAVLVLSGAESQAEVKAAFRSRALVTHPEKGGADKAFREVFHAFSVLYDPKERHRYDAGLGL